MYQVYPKADSRSNSLYAIKYGNSSRVKVHQRTTDWNVGASVRTTQLTSLFHPDTRSETSSLLDVSIVWLARRIGLKPLKFTESARECPQIQKLRDIQSQDSRSGNLSIFGKSIMHRSQSGYTLFFIKKKSL